MENQAQPPFYSGRRFDEQSSRLWRTKRSHHSTVDADSASGAPRTTRRSFKERSQAPTTVPLGRFSSSPQLLRHQTNMNHHSYITIINLKTHLHDSHVTRHHITSKLPKLLNHKTKHGAILLTSQDLHCELTHTALPAPPLAPHPNCGILPE